MGWSAGSAIFKDNSSHVGQGGQLQIFGVSFSWVKPGWRDRQKEPPRPRRSLQSPTQAPRLQGSREPRGPGGGHCSHGQLYLWGLGRSGGGGRHARGA
jgi:hypothetical protein